MKKKHSKFIISGLLLFLFLSFFLLFLKTNPSDKLIEVKKGDTFHSIANVLSKNNIIKSKKIFILLVKFTGGSRNLKTGIYQFNKTKNIWKIIKSLRKGRIASKVFTIPEGYNIFQIADMLEKKNIIDKNSFLTYIKDEKILLKFNIHQKTAEGYLFPETYYVPYNISAEELIEIMIENFFSRINKSYLKKLKEKYGNLEKAVILASLVEGEAKTDFERPIIAGVFLNRLKMNMNLQSCASIMYTLDSHKERLYYKDLKTASPYNTYLCKGLPPAPICNPSEKSILAVIYPANTSYLYFVSMQNGMHYFTSAYSQHIKAYKYFILKEANPDYLP